MRSPFPPLRVPQVPPSPQASPMGRSPASLPSSNLVVMNCINRRFVPPLVVPRRSLWAVIIAEWSLYKCPAVPGALFISRAAAEVWRNSVAFCMTAGGRAGGWRREDVGGDETRLKRTWVISAASTRAMSEFGMKIFLIQDVDDVA